MKVENTIKNDNTMKNDNLIDLRQFNHIMDLYVPIEIIGEGTFSTVYKAIDVKNSKLSQQYVALKCITRTTMPARIYEELRILKHLQGNHNTIELLNIKRYEDLIIAVFPCVEYVEIREFISDCTMSDIKYYMHSLFKALNYIHKNKIIHRDIKPANFLYDRIKKQGVLIDFGLAQFEDLKRNVREGKEVKKSLIFNSNLSKATNPPGYFLNDGRKPMRAERGGTRGFRAPEVLFKIQSQTSKIDIWSAGIILLILFTKQYPFFHSMDDIDALVEIATIFGNNQMKAAASLYNRVWKCNISTVPNEFIGFEEIIKKMNKSGFDWPGIDLLNMCLTLWDEKRCTAEEALYQPFFHEISSTLY